MSPVLLVFGAVATVDRIDGDLAILEWRDLAFTEVPVALLPVGTDEGDRVVVRTRRVSRISVRGPQRGPHGAARARGRRTE